MGDLESHSPAVPAGTKLNDFLSSSELPGSPVEIGRSRVLITQRVLHKFECEKKWFSVMAIQKCQNEIHRWQTWESRDWKKGWYALINESFSFILFWKEMLFHTNLKEKTSPYCFGHFHFLQGLVLLKAVIKRTSSPKVIWKCIKLSSSSTVWN